MKAFPSEEYKLHIILLQDIDPVREVHTRSPNLECGLTSLVVCINVQTRDIKKRNVTIRSEYLNTKHPFSRVWGI